MGLFPVPCNVQPSADPHPIKLFNMVQKTLQCCDASGAAQQSAVHADAHHAGAGLPFCVQDVKAVFEVLKEGVGVVMDASCANGFSRAL